MLQSQGLSRPPLPIQCGLGRLPALPRSDSCCRLPGAPVLAETRQAERSCQGAGACRSISPLTFAPAELGEQACRAALGTCAGLPRARVKPRRPCASRPGSRTCRPTLVSPCATVCGTFPVHSEGGWARAGCSSHRQGLHSPPSLCASVSPKAEWGWQPCPTYMGW